MKKLILAFALCFGILVGVALAHEFVEGDPFEKSMMYMLDENRSEQQEKLNQFNFFGLLSEDEIDAVGDLLADELGHFLGSKIAAAENDYERYEYHINIRIEIQREMEEILIDILERVEEEQQEAAPPAPKQDL